MADTKVVKVKAGSNRGFWTRSIFASTPEKNIEKETIKWAKKGYVLVNTNPIADSKGKTTHFLLTFRKE
jgi:hypothetical protein